MESDQVVQCPSCLQQVALKLMQSTHLDSDCPGQPSNLDLVLVSDLLNANNGPVRRKPKQNQQEPGDFLSEDRWLKRKAIAASANSLMSPGMRHLGKIRKRQVSADDKALDALLNNSIDQSALDSLKMMVLQGIELPPEPFVYILFEILNKDASLIMATACYLSAIELMQMDPLMWIPLDTQCDRFWQVFTQVLGQPTEYVQNNNLLAFRKAIMFARVFILAFHLDIRQRKSEGLDCREAILRKQIEVAAIKKRDSLEAFLDELNQVYFLAQIAVADATCNLVPKRYRVEALGLAEAFQRLMNNCFPDA